VVPLLRGLRGGQLMARDRTHDEIVDQLVYAAACVARHYGPGLSADGLQAMRKSLDAEGPWWCDSTWRVDVQEPNYYGDSRLEGHSLDEPNPDFCPLVLKDGYLGLNFREVVEQSRGGEEV
jgi:hypothetical protein